MRAFLIPKIQSKKKVNPKKESNKLWLFLRKWTFKRIVFVAVVVVAVVSSLIGQSIYILGHIYINQLKHTSHTTDTRSKYIGFQHIQQQKYAQKTTSTHKHTAENQKKKQQQLNLLAKN